jgi:hypothetical protein
MAAAAFLANQAQNEVYLASLEARSAEINGSSFNFLSSTIT